MNADFAKIINSFNAGLGKHIPASFGNCTDVQPTAWFGSKTEEILAPRPCIGTAPIYYVRTSIYEALGRWFTGINTAHLETMEVQVIPSPPPRSQSRDDHDDCGEKENGLHNNHIDNNYTNVSNFWRSWFLPSRQHGQESEARAVVFARQLESRSRPPSTLSFSITGKIKDLKLSLRIAECWSPDVWVTKRCDTLWDNADSCCGDDISFRISASAECHNEFPFLRHQRLNEINVSTLAIKERIIWGRRYTFQDITAAVVSWLHNIVSSYTEAVSGDPMFSLLEWNGRQMVLADVLNQALFYNYPEGLICPPATEEIVG